MTSSWHTLLLSFTAKKFAKQVSIWWSSSYNFLSHSVHDQVFLSNSTNVQPINWHMTMIRFFYQTVQIYNQQTLTHTQTHTHTRSTALSPGLPRSAGTRKVKPIWILLEQKTVSGSGISCAICKSAHHSRHITMPAPHHSVFYRPDALPAAQPTVSKHWRHKLWHMLERIHKI